MDLTRKQLRNILPTFLGGNTQTTKNLTLHINTAVSNTNTYTYPTITDNDFQQIRYNYIKSINSYNISIKKPNKEIKEYNKHVKTNLTKTQQDFVREFEKKYKKLLTNNYNTKVEHYTKKYGNWFKYRKYQPVRQQHEDTFKFLIGIYKTQINRTTITLASINGRYIPRQLKMLSLNYTNATKRQIQNQQATQRSIGSLKDHIKRLREANIINNYVFTNRRTPVKLQINPNILVISDLKTSKPQNTRNQLNKSSIKQKLDIHCTSSVLVIEKNNKKNIKGVFKNENNNDVLQTALQEHQSVINTNETQQLQKRKKIAAKKEKDTIFTNSSQYLQTQLLSIIQLVKMLTTKTINTQLISRDQLEYESELGFLSTSQFMKLITQEITKAAYNKFYKNHQLQVFGGNWYKTIERWQKQTFLVGKHPYKKTIMLQIYDQYMLAIKLADNWFTANEYKDILMPYDYFDPSRKNNFEVGFKFMLNRAIKIIEKEKIKETTLKQQKTNQKLHAKARRKFNNLKRYVKNYQKGHKTLNQLLNYTQHHCPEYTNQLNKLIKTTTPLKTLKKS